MEDIPPSPPKPPTPIGGVSANTNAILFLCACLLYILMDVQGILIMRLDHQELSTPITPITPTHTMGKPCNFKEKAFTWSWLRKQNGVIVSHAQDGVQLFIVIVCKTIFFEAEWSLVQNRQSCDMMSIGCNDTIVGFRSAIRFDLSHHPMLLQTSTKGS